MKFTLTWSLMMMSIAMLSGCQCHPDKAGTPNAAPHLRDIDVLCHYMTWFSRAEVDGETRYEHWGWQGNGPHHDPRQITGSWRDIASVDYPRIGPYDSNDPDVIDYHILTAQAAGIQCFVVDWYGPDSHVNKSLLSLMDRAAALHFNVAICYEEKTCFPDWNQITTRQEAVDKALKDFTYLRETILTHPAYWHKNDQPAVFVFNGWGDWPGLGQKLFTADEWQQIFEQSQTTHIQLVRQNVSDYANVRAGYGWCGDADYRSWFYRTGDQMLLDNKLDFYVGSASPGFDDRGVWGWGNKPRFEASLGTANFADYCQHFEHSQSDTIQLVTWNDFEEGTIIEPTAQFGNLYLEYTQQALARITGRPAHPQALELPYRWFFYKKFAPEETSSELVSAAHAALASQKYTQAATILNTLASQTGLTVPPYLSTAHEYTFPSVHVQE